jgi:GTPase SAR1 family protein
MALLKSLLFVCSKSRGLVIHRLTVIISYKSIHQNTLVYIGILQPPGMTANVEVRNGGDDSDAFARTLLSDLREHFPPDIQRVPPARRSVIIANYERMVGGEPGGHWNVLGGVWWRPSAAEPDFDQTYVLLMSGDAGLWKLPTHWISLREFVKTCSLFVGSNKVYRGYVVLTLESVAAAGDSGGGDAVEQSDSDLSENAVQDALKGVGATFAPLRRAKVILCGQGRVGKTSLRKALTGMQFNADELSTAGAQVTCALRRVEADQADGEWSVQDVSMSSWKGQCLSKAELRYITQRCGSDAAHAAAWAASIRRRTALGEHDDAAATQQQPGNDVDSVSSEAMTDASNTESAKPTSSDVSIDNAGILDEAAESAETDSPAFVPESPLPNLGVNNNDIATHTPHDEEADRQLARLEKSGEDLPIKVSVWDLGGQRLFQALQQMFLTKSAIYVVTFCLTHFTAGASDGDDEAAAELRFWCDTVASCVRGKSNGESGRIVVVGTCLDQISSDAEVDAARQRAADVIGSTLLRGVVSVDDIFCVDNSRRDGGTSVAGLRGVLDKHISESSDVTAPVRDTHCSCKR